MNVPEKWKDLAHAWVDGAEIEARHRAIRLEWGNVDFPTWSEDFEYRIKPKAKVKKWRWVAGTRETKHIFITPECYSSAAEVMAESPVWVPIEKIDATEKECDE